MVWGARMWEPKAPVQSAPTEVIVKTRQRSVAKTAAVPAQRHQRWPLSVFSDENTRVLQFIMENADAYGGLDLEQLRD
jgi:hypothetical protein